MIPKHIVCQDRQCKGKMPEPMENDMKSDFYTKSVAHIIDLAVNGKLNPDPISQRPATSSGFKKGQEIIEAIKSGVGVGMITVRDISKDPKMQEVYPGVHYLVIDGGHRVRAFAEFYTNKFKVNGKYFTETEDTSFLKTPIPFEVITCTSEEATKIFRTRNKTTSVNFIEMIMCDDESSICREVRSRTKYYKEYKNDVHPLFEAKRNTKGEWVPDCFDSDLNPRRKWDEYVFIAILKTIGGGNVDAGQREIEALVHGEYDGKNPVSKNVLKTVDRFLNDTAELRYRRGGRGLNGDIFAAFQTVWFALYEQNREFKISDPYKFKDEFMRAYSKLTGTGNNLYNDRTINVGTEDEPEYVFVKEFVRCNTKNFSNSVVQRQCAKILLEEMGKDIGVTFRDAKRSLSTAQREEMLAIQGYKCAIDGAPLTLEDSVWGHDTPWAQGGQLMEGAVIRKSHNRDMGCTTLDEYRLILNMRKKNKAA